MALIDEVTQKPQPSPAPTPAAPQGALAAGDQIAVTTTPAVVIQDPTYRDAVTILADSENTDTVLIGNTTLQTFPLLAGASVTVKHTSFSLIYAKSASGTQTLHLITGGS
jgi:hypothetical protein